MSRRFSLAASLVRVSVLLVFCTALILYNMVRPVWVKRLPDESAKWVNAELLRKHVEVLSSELLPRSAEHPENLQAAANYITGQLKQFNSAVQLQTYAHAGKNYSNVVASFGPDSQEIIVVGAHYDAYSIFPGADDNASGTAALIELARLLATQTLHKRIELVFYTCEEPPNFATEAMGSFVHAASISHKTVRLMISLEMLGFYSQAENSQRYPLGFLRYIYPDKGNFIAVIDQLFGSDASGLKASINTWTQLEAYSMNAPRYVPGVDFSDHRNYWAHNMPAIMVTDTAFMRNAYYHQASDLPHTLDYVKMAQVVYGVYKFVLTL